MQHIEKMGTMKHMQLALGMMLFIVLAAPLNAGSLNQAPNWDRQRAEEVARVFDTQSVVADLKSAMSADDPEELMAALRLLEARDDVPGPAREAALLRFMQELRSLSAAGVSSEVMAYLGAWQARTFVANDHQPGVGEPLYKIRSAAAGIKNGWRQDTAFHTGITMLNSRPRTFLAQWSSASDPATRAGYLDALGEAGATGTRLVHEQVMAELAANPGLTEVAARTMLVTGDVAALEAIIRYGEGAGVVSALRSAALSLSPQRATAIISQLAATGLAEKAALAIGVWTPLLAGESDAQALLQQLLGDDVLGPAAVLALQWSPVSKEPLKPSLIEGEAGLNPRIVTWSGDSIADPDDDLLSLGYPVPIPVDTPLPFDGFRSYSGLHSRHQNLAMTTKWVHPAEVGLTHAGRTVWAYRLGDEDTFTPYGLPEPASLINGGIHSREWQSPEVATGIMELMVEQAGDHYFYDYLLENANMIVVPVLNIDGFLQTQRYPTTNWYETDPLEMAGDPQPSPRDGRMRRKNMLEVDEDLETIDDHLLGVDLNRNFPPLWATSSSSSAEETSLVHHGEAALSEPETQALLAAAALGPVDQLRTYTDLHSFAQVHFWARTNNVRLSDITRNVMTNFSNHHASFSAGRFYGFGSGQEPGVGAGFAYEYFPYELGTVTWLTEIEPRNSCCWDEPTAGAEYGGVVENGHDGFILPDSQIRRVREELSQSFASTYYQMAGPPSITTVRFVDSVTGSTVFEAEWDVVSNTERELHVFETQPLQFDRNYKLWLSYDKPMRWRTDGMIVPFPGQPDSTLNIEADILVNDESLTLIVGEVAWLDIPGDTPAGYQRYQDDAIAAEFSLPLDEINGALITGNAIANLRWSAFDMTGQENDANPSTVARWEGGNWVGYEDSNGADGDIGGLDSTIQIALTSEDLGAPFVVEAGTSSSWFDLTHNGEGFMLEILAADRAVLYWFTYDDEGEQDWYIAVGEIRGNRIVFPELLRVSGGVFGPDFDPDAITNEVVGSAAFIWSGCDTGSMDWQIGNRHGRQHLVRLTRVMGIDCGRVQLPPQRVEALLAGSWFDPSHSGEGYTLEVLVDDRVLVFWFTFDPAGARRWFIGIGEIQDGKFVFDDMMTTRGGIFGDDFDPATVDFSHWGTLELDLTCSGGTAGYASTEDGFGSGSLDVTQLSSLAGLECDG